MSNNSNERDVAKRFGFDAPRGRLPEISSSLTSGTGASLSEVMGIKSGTRVVLAGTAASPLRAALAGAGAKVTTLLPSETAECVIFAAETTYSLRRVAELARCLGHSGVLWVLWPRAKGHISQQHVRRAGAAAGLADVHAVHVDARLSGVKFVRREVSR